MVAGDARVRDHQILVHLSSYAERTVIKIDDTLLVPLDKHERGEDSRAGSGGRANDGLKSHVALQCSLNSQME
jgi:hypothetical protein